MKSWYTVWIGVILIIISIVIIKTQIEEYTLQHDPMLDLLRRVVQPIHPVMNKVKIYKADKSYTINKEKIFLCLKDKNSNYYPLNMLIYVFLHELAHLLNTKDVGHTETFHQIFDELREKAFKLGIYNPSIQVIPNYSE